MKINFLKGRNWVCFAFFFLGKKQGMLVLGGLATVLLATSSVALAECPIREHDRPTHQQTTSLLMSSGARLTLEGELLRVRVLMVDISTTQLSNLTQVFLHQ